MPVKRRVTRKSCKAKKAKVVKFCGRSRGVRGGSLWSWIRKKALPWLKKNSIISKAANLLGNAGVPYANTVGRVAGTLGYGRMANLKKYGKKANTYAKRHNVLSRGLNFASRLDIGKKHQANLLKAAVIAKSYGYGLNRTGRGLNRTGGQLCHTKRRKRKN